MSTRRFQQVGSPSENEEVHDSTKRLLDYAKRATAEDARPVLGFTTLNERLGVSSATMTNWKKRGVSKDGAIKAEKAFGCSVQWILDGVGSAAASHEGAPTGLATGVALPTYFRQPTSPASAMESLLVNLVRQLEGTDEITRKAVASMLADLVLQPDKAVSIAAGITGLISGRAKRTG